jgi:hypothetical protein
MRSVSATGAATAVGVTAPDEVMLSVIVSDSYDGSTGAADSDTAGSLEAGASPNPSQERTGSGGYLGKRPSVAARLHK